MFSTQTGKKNRKYPGTPDFQQTRPWTGTRDTAHDYLHTLIEQKISFDMCIRFLSCVLFVLCSPTVIKKPAEVL